VQDDILHRNLQFYTSAPKDFPIFPPRTKLFRYKFNKIIISLHFFWRHKKLLKLKKEMSIKFGQRKNCLLSFHIHSIFIIIFWIHFVHYEIIAIYLNFLRFLRERLFFNIFIHAIICELFLCAVTGDFFLRLPQALMEEYWNKFDDETSPDDEVDRKKMHFIYVIWKINENNKEIFVLWWKIVFFHWKVKGGNKLENLLN